MNKFSALMVGAGLALSSMTAGAATFVGDRTDFRDETIYFAMTTRFYDGDPKNNVCCWDGRADQEKNNDPCWRGDFKGLIDKLDYIKALGFTAIWITPIVQNASGFDYHGYHAMDFSKVDLRYESRKEWGSAEDVKFEDLINEAHKRDMKVILDIVLQHTGNFGEDYFCHLFDRDQDIRNQANIECCLVPDEERLGGDSYWDLPNDGAKTQYSERFKYLKNTDGQNHDDKNYWHHLSTSWNWDDPSRWWGQIAGDCVDLNTENPAVVDYLVECYGKFIAMGLDGFRIDTTGHIAPLTFNAAFLPKFIELGEKYKDKRLNGAPFYMFGECCARFGSVIYRDQHRLSSHYYTWKSDPSLVSEWQQYDADWWAKQVVKEGADPLGNMLTCEKDPGTVHNSDNVFMKNGAWHEPDYSQASGLNVIDFPMHYNFNDAGQAVRIAQEGDKYYNDASWNVVYVDSHDYSPGPNDGIRFNGGTAQWAENTALMFTFRGIPCIYYGSEVEFQKGIKIDEGPNLALKNSGRAYFGEYLKGSVEASDFGEYTASGNVQKTLDADLAQHIRRLNQIRAAVPALRKGQYTWDGCTADGGWAFKRAYKDSYALVAINGGATFSNVPAGTFTDIVTGKTYQGGGTITVSAPKNQGQLRVLVKDWKGSNKQVGEHGKFIYDTTPVSHGGSVSFTDPGTTEYWKFEDAKKTLGAAVSFSPNGGSFRTETIKVTATLTEGATTGWYQVGNGQKVNLSSSNRTSTFTLGADMDFGQTVSVKWSATGEKGEKNGTVTYKKIDPNAAINIYVKASTAPNIYLWGNDNNGKNVEPAGKWPGTKMKDTADVNGESFFVWTVTELESVNMILSNNGQTGDITGIDSDVYYEYDGGSNATKLDISVTPGPKKPTITADPASGTKFTDNLDVTLTVRDAQDVYYTLDGSNPSMSSTKYTKPIHLTATTTIKAYAKNDAGETTATFTYTKREPASGFNIYVKAPSAPYIYLWNDNQTDIAGKWPGAQMTDTEVVNDEKFYVYNVTEVKTVNMILNNGNGQQTGDISGISEDVYYEYDGASTAKQLEIIVTPQPKKPTITASPASGTTFTDNLDVTLTVSEAQDVYYTLDGSNPSMNSTKYTKPIHLTATTTIKAYAKNDAGETTATFTYTKREPTSGFNIYVKADNAPYIYLWNDDQIDIAGAWPGAQMTDTEVVKDVKFYVYNVTGAKTVNMILSYNGKQTGDITGISGDVYYDYDGDSQATVHNFSTVDPSQPGEYTVYFDNSVSNWGDVYAYCWDDNHKDEMGNAFSGKWPGQKLETKTVDGNIYYVYTVTSENGLQNPKVIFNNGNGDQTSDFVFVHNSIYDRNGAKGQMTNVIMTVVDGGEETVFYNLQGQRVSQPVSGGIYIMRRGNKTAKILWN